MAGAAGNGGGSGTEANSAGLGGSMTSSDPSLGAAGDDNGVGAGGEVPVSTPDRGADGGAAFTGDSGIFDAGNSVTVP
jgi:hypothetical protein